MKLAVLGGTGFLGRHVCESLARRNLVATTISRSPDQEFLKHYAPTITGLLAGSDGAREALLSADTIIHLGHVSRPGSEPDAAMTELERNIAPMVELVRMISANKPGVRIIYTSTGGQIYGPGHRSPIPEMVAPAPTTSYALGKQLVEQILDYYARKGLIRSLILRLANPVGRWQFGGRHGFVSTVVANTLSGEKTTIFGPGNNARDYFDADDFAALLVDLAENRDAPDGTYNIGTGIGLTEKDVITKVATTLGHSPLVTYEAARSFDLDYAVLDPGRAESRLGWKPKTPLESTILYLKEAFEQRQRSRGE